MESETPTRTPEQRLIASGFLVGHLNRALLGTERGLRTVPGVLKRVIEEGMWRDRTDPDSGRRYTFATFEEFVAAHHPDGLGTTIDHLRGICSEDVEARDAIDRATQRPPSRHALDNIQGMAPTGTSESAALRRLRKDRPDLHAQVLAGELSAHAAALQAGFRRQTATVPVDTPEAAIRALSRRFTREQLQAALDHGD
jgi:hypothetical protein